MVTVQKKSCMQPQPQEQKASNMKKFRELSEQYREEGRHKLIYPKNKAVVSPRPENDSAKAKLGEEKNMNEEKDEKEYDYEGEMVKSDLRSVIANANRLIDMLEDDDNLPEWCQNKITLAEDYISTVANYMTAEMNEEVEQLDEKNVPTNPGLWSRAKSLARSKFDVYPSAYANGWAAKWYKSKGGGWRSVNEENYEVTVMHTTKDGDKGEQTHTIKNADSSRHAKNIALQRHEKMLNSKGTEVRGMATTTAKMVEAKEDDLPFTPDKPKKKSVVVGKKPEGYSVARHLARQAMQKQVEKMKKKPMKEETNKAKIVKDVMKKNKKSSEDAFQKDPELSSTLTKGF